jgi:signal transduction histidine kinase
MLDDIERKLLWVNLALLAVFAWGLGFLYLVSTVLFNSAQVRWELFCFTWEAAVLGLPLAVFRPVFRPIRRYVRQLESGTALSPAEASRLEQKILAYPFKVSLVVLIGAVGAYGLGSLQMRYFADLPLEGLIITMICGLASAILWAALQYFLMEYYLRPLTGLAAAVAGSGAVSQSASLAAKILGCSIALVVASLSFFGVAAYSRAAHVIEVEAGTNLTERMREAANLIGALPRTAGGGLSDSWGWVASEFRISPRGYLHVIDGTGRILASHPTVGKKEAATLADEELHSEVRNTILSTAEGHLTDRVRNSKVVSFVEVPGSPWKLLAVAPMRDLSPQLDELLYTGAVAMAFAALLSIGVGFVCARTITTSLGAVTRVARAVADNRDLSRRVAFVTNDEVGVLARAFNQMAQELQTYAGGLEQRVVERTEELRQRTEQLETKNAELSDFLFIASHDLRSPLINLDGFSHALQDSLARFQQLVEEATARGNGSTAGMIGASWPALREEMEESLGFILRSTEKMDFLVRALLDLSRIDAQQPGKQEIDLARMVSDILGTFQFQIHEKGIRISTGDLPRVAGDPVRINQVFSNLIDNAIKYMPPKQGARIEIGCDAANGHYRFFVRDNGIGIRPEDHEKVFRLFTRVSANGALGEGVGLTAVRKIIDKHGGRIWVESEPGRGTTFRFTLPLQG